MVNVTCWPPGMLWKQGKSHSCVSYIQKTLYLMATRKPLPLALMLKRILIVDDSESVRDVIRMFLKDVTTVEICGEASNGLEAVEKAKRLQPDLVVLDL